jgi:hypothetical protein
MFQLISWGCFQVQLFFLFLGAMSHFDWPITQSKYFFGDTQNGSFYLKMEGLPPLVCQYRCKGDKFDCSEWDKSVVLEVTSCGTHWHLVESFWNLMRTTTTKKMPKNPKPTLPTRKKNPQPIGCMLHHLIGGAKFLFVHLFVAVFYQG